MHDFLRGIAGLVVIAVALGLVRIFRGSQDADRMMAVQLIGTGGVAVMILLAAAGGRPAALDVALTLGLLTAFSSVAFVKCQPPPSGKETDE